MTFNESFFRNAKLTGAMIAGTALSALSQTGDAPKSVDGQRIGLNPTEVFAKYSINPDSLIIPVDTIKYDQGVINKIILEESDSPPDPPILAEIQKLMTGYHMDISPKDFDSEEAFVKKYVEEALKFSKSENGKQIIKLKKLYYKGKYEDCKNKLKTLRKDRTSFKPIYFCNDEFDEVFGAYENVDDYIAALEGYIESYEKGELTGQIPLATKDYINQAKEVWGGYELNKRIEAMGGEGMDLEINFSDSTNLKIPFKELENINFFETSDFSGDLFGAIGIMPDSSGTFTVTMPRINEGKLVLNKVSKKVIDNFLSGVVGKEDALTSAPGDPDEGLVTADRPVIVYESNLFFERLLENGHDMKELEGQILKDMKLRVLLFHEDWETFVKKWREKNPKKN
ncbi:MAG: hypothetical protein ACKOW9_03645 [Candidatus Paceibacterota bacterium]